MPLAQHLHLCGVILFILVGGLDARHLLVGEVEHCSSFFTLCPFSQPLDFIQT